MILALVAALLSPVKLATPIPAIVVIVFIEMGALGDAEGITVGMLDEGFIVGIIVGCVGNILGLYEVAIVALRIRLFA